MMKRRVLSVEGQRRVRMGRKALVSARIQALTDARKDAEPKPASPHSEKGGRFGRLLQMLPKFKPYGLVLVVLAVVAVASSGGYALYASHREGVRAAEERAAADEARVESQKAATCLERRGDAYGQGMTFAQLYSSACVDD